MDIQMLQLQDLVKDHGYTFFKYKLIDFFEVFMLTISFVCAIDVKLNVTYYKFKINMLRKKGAHKVCRVKIIEK